MSYTNTTLTRRQFITLSAIGAIALAAPSFAMGDHKTIVVLTNHNDDTFSLIEEAFEKSQDQYKLKFIWLMPPDASKLIKDAKENIDVWWQAAPHNHIEDLSKKGGLQPLQMSFDNLPSKIGETSLGDSEHLFHATQLYGMNFLINKETIKKNKLPWPSDWSVLGSAEYSGMIAITDPKKLKFGTLMIDIILQSYGWKEGWALLSAITGNAETVEDNLGLDVFNGRHAVGLQTDITPNGEQRVPAGIERTYPKHGGIINAGYIGVLKNAAESEGAQAFARFILSEEGQKLMTHTDLPRLPIRPDVYKSLDKTQYNPFSSQAAGEYVYQPKHMPISAQILQALYASMTIDRPKLKEIWKRVHAAESSFMKKRPSTETKSAVAQARTLLESVVISYDEALSPALQEAFKPIKRPKEETKPALSDSNTTEIKPKNSNEIPFDQPKASRYSEAAMGYIYRWEESYHSNLAEAERKLNGAGL